VLLQAFRKIACNAGVVLLGISFADENVNVKKSLHFLACQAVVLESLTSSAIQHGPPSLYSGVADLRFALALQAKVWSLGGPFPFCHLRLIWRKNRLTKS